jgi:hypothetical protein
VDRHADLYALAAYADAHADVHADPDLDAVSSRLQAETAPARAFRAADDRF